MHARDMRPVTEQALRHVEMRREIFNGERFPASTLITVTAFARPETLLEVQGMAVIA